MRVIVKSMLPPIRHHSQAVRHPLTLVSYSVEAGFRLFRLVNQSSRPRTRCAIIQDNHILLVRNVGSSRYWGLPGGGLNHDESAIDCIAREVREELAINANVDSYRYIDRFYGETSDLPLDCFTLALSTTTPIKPSLEIIEARWFPVNRLPSNSRAYLSALIAATLSS